MKFLTARCKGKFAALLGCLTHSRPAYWCTTLGTLLRRSFYEIRLPNKLSHVLFCVPACVVKDVSHISTHTVPSESIKTLQTFGFMMKR